MTPTGGPIAPAVPAAEYAYVGLGHLVGTTLPEPEARWVLSEHATSGDLYPDLDRFDRVVLSRWTGYRNSGTRDFYSVALTYDRNSNVTGATDHVHKNVGGNRNFDARYAIDGLDRLTRAEEGTLAFPGGVPTLSYSASPPPPAFCHAAPPPADRQIFRSSSRYPIASAMWACVIASAPSRSASVRETRRTLS